MSTLSLLTWIQNTSLARAITESNHLVGAGLQIAHVMGLIMLLAALVLLTLKVLGLILPQQDRLQIAAEAARLMWLGLGVTSVSGVLMFISAPRLYFYNVAFGVKMVLLLLAVSWQALALRRVQAPASAPQSLKLHITAALACWFGVAFAGRMIGFV